MRFKKGEKVEVMNKDEAPISWLFAKVLSCNGQTCRLQYDSHPGRASKKMVDTVSRKIVRPSPPPVQGLDPSIAGDIVEVFHECSWKIAAILKVLEGETENKLSKIYLQDVAVEEQYLVRLLGSSKDIIVDGSKIRTRQTWHGDKWILMAKSSRVGEEAIAGKPSTLNCYQNKNFQIPQSNTRMERQPRKNCDQLQNDAAAILDYPVFSSRPLKRMSPFGSSILDVRNGCIKRAKSLEKDVQQKEVADSPDLEKVDAVAYPRKLLGEESMHASINIISNRYNHMERTKLSEVHGYSGVKSSELSSSGSDACSVGSCSVATQSPNYCGLFLPLPYQEAEALCSDAESCYGSSSERKCSSLPPKEEVESSIHRLELLAYRRTLEALFASGPLSWEQEALLTNLRIMLHISNDEHLTELKHLISTKISLNVR